MKLFSLSRIKTGASVFLAAVALPGSIFGQATAEAGPVKTDTAAPAPAPAPATATATANPAVIAASHTHKTSPSRSTVRVNATRQNFNLTRPWEKNSPDGRRGLGAVLSGNRVIITAETVANATYIELELPESGKKATAEVVAIDYEANLALVAPTAEHAQFLKDCEPMELARDVAPGDLLHLWQIEGNGTPLETPVVVSRGEVGGYFVPGAYFFLYEASGTLQYHSGSFTLPVAKNGKLAGLLLTYSSKEQSSNILPASIIEHFLKEQEDGEYNGFAGLGIAYALTLDDQFRKYLKLDDVEGGVFVRKVVKGSSADRANIRQGDVIIEVSGHPIDARGNYDDPVFGKLNMSHLVRGIGFVGDTIPMKIVRDGEVQEIPVTLFRREPEEMLVDPYMFDRGPKFLILGGLIFQELTRPYLELYGDNWKSRAPIKLLLAQAEPEEFEKKGLKKVVFLTRVVPTPATLGYESLNSVILKKVNGRDIKDIKDVDEALMYPTDGIHRIEFDEFPKVIFVDADLASAINKQLEQRIGTIKRLD